MPRGVPKSGMQRLMAELQKAKQDLEGQLQKISSVLRSLGSGGTSSAKRAGSGGKRRLSAAGRAAIAKAAKKRWAKYRAVKNKGRNG